MTPNKRVEHTARPHTVGLIGWLFLIAGVLSVVATPFFLIYRPVIQASWHNPDVNFAAAVVIFIILGICYVIAGFAILKGKSWGRTFYVIFGLIFVVLSFDFYNQMLLAVLSGLLPYIVLVWQLTRKESNEWFAAA